MGKKLTTTWILGTELATVGSSKNQTLKSAQPVAQDTLTTLHLPRETDFRKEIQRLEVSSCSWLTTGEMRMVSAL